MSKNVGKTKSITRENAVSGIAAFAVVLLFIIPARMNAITIDEPGRWAIVGRWDITIHSSKGDYPSWLEVRR